MKSPLVYDHASFGWWIYAANLIPFFLIARWIERSEPPARVRSSAVRSTLLPASAVVKGLTLLVVAVIGGFGAASLIHRTGHAQSGFSVSGEALLIAPNFRPQYAGYDLEQAWALPDSTGNFELLALTYLRQEKEKKLIYYRNVIADEDHLHGVSRIVTAEGIPLNVSMVSGDTWYLVWWYYWIDGSITTSPLKAKLLQFRAMLLGDPSAALITLSQRCFDIGCRAEIDGAAGENIKNALQQATRLKVVR